VDFKHVRLSRSFFMRDFALTKPGTAGRAEVHSQISLELVSVGPRSTADVGRNRRVKGKRS
jgi:hypothetical protein